MLVVLSSSRGVRLGGGAAAVLGGRARGPFAGGSAPRQLDGPGELRVERGVRPVGEERDDDRDDEVRDEAGQQLVQGEDAAEGVAQVVPEEHERRADDHAGGRARRREPAPPQGQQGGRSEAGAETGPGEGHETEDRVAAADRQGHGDDGYGEHADAAGPDALGGGEGPARDAAVEVLDEGRRGDDELAGDRRHDGGQDGGQEEAGDERVEEQLGQRDEDRLGIGQTGRVVLVDGHADQGRRDCPQVRQDHPADADAAGPSGLGGRAQRHEAHEDVRLAEVAQAPGEGGDDADEGAAVDERGEVGVDAADRGQRLARAPQADDADDRQDDEGEDHHETLDDIGPRDGEEAADERVEHGDAGHQEHAPQIGQVEARLEEGAAGDHAGGDVEGEVDEDDEARDDAQDAALVVEAVAVEAGDRDRVARRLGVAAQPRGDDPPVEPGADREADADPRLDEARRVDGAGQAHEQPAARVGGPGAERRDERGQSSPAEHVVVEVDGLVVAPEADGDHGPQVDDHRHDLPCEGAHAGALRSAGRSQRVGVKQN